MDSQLGPNTISSSGTRTVATFTLTLPALANPETNQEVYTCLLRVRDNKGAWSSWRQYNLFHRTSKSLYYLTDQIGNVRATVDHTGNLVGYDDFDPFGNVLPGRSMNAANPNDIYKFTGHERDPEIGLDYMIARNYDPEIWRLLSVDPAHSLAPGWSPYRYAFNNPVKYIDQEGNFELDAALANKYPRLAQYLRYTIQDITKNNKVTKALMKHGEFSRNDIINGLKYGQGPKINVTATPGAYGSYDPKNPNELKISDELVKALENATGRERDALLFLVAVTILHEFTHFGDFQDGAQQRDAKGKLIEEGELFEIDAYGKIIGGNNASNTIQDYLKKFEKAESSIERKSAGVIRLINNFDNLESGTHTWNGFDWEREEN